jgi:hypothetical protein
MKYSFTTITRHPFFLPILAAVAMLVMAFNVTPESLFAVPIAGVLLSETKRNADFIVSEAPGKLSRDNVTLTVAANSTILAGTVLGVLSGDGNYVAYDPAASDGSETPIGILYRHAVNGSDEELEIEGVVINCCAEVRSAGLVWPDAISEEDKADAVEALRAAFIKVRPL